MLSLALLASGSPRVFPTHPRPEGYFPSQAAEEARSKLVRCLERGEGPALLIGTPGVGKSSLLGVLCAQLSKKFHVASLTSVQLCTRRALLQSILFSLGQPYRHREEGELRIALIDYLTRDPESKNGTVLLVDEAQALPQRLLEELRMLGNLAPEGEASVRMLLAGGPHLEELFAAPENEAFNQRISTRCYLAPLSHADTAQYVRSHIEAAGGNANELVTPEALDAVYNASDGIPRLINQVCDRALLVATDAGYQRLEPAIIETAWADLQQLPTPWELPHQTQDFGADVDDTAQSSVVEFGPLSDDNDPPPVSQPKLMRNTEEDETDDADLDLLPLDDVVAGSISQTVAVDETVDATEPVSVKPFAEPIRQPERTYADPFGEEFEDEELVIESFASMDALLPSTTQLVVNRIDGGETSRRLANVATPNPTGKSDLQVDSASKSSSQGLALYEDDGDEQTKPEDHQQSQTHQSLNPCHIENWDDSEWQEIAGRGSHEIDDAEQLPEALTTSESTFESAPENGDEDGLDLLVVDNEDVPAGVVAVDRRDYRQLFATLRRG